MSFELPEKKVYFYYLEIRDKYSFWGKIIQYIIITDKTMEDIRGLYDSRNEIVNMHRIPETSRGCIQSKQDRGHIIKTHFENV